MSTVYFFTNPTGLQQTVQQRYGPVNGQEDSQYRVTSQFSSTGNPRAYAICRGKVFAQQAGGKINLVLRPMTQPTGIHAAVRYYIYRCVLSDSLISSADATLIADASQSDLTAAIQKGQSDRNAARNLTGSAAPKAGLGAIGLNRTATAATPQQLLDAQFIDEVFLSLDADEYPIVNGGANLGRFDPASFGLEIVLDALGGGPRVSTARNSATIISALPSPANDAERFRDVDQREKILDYIDPCAFYAAFVLDGILVKKQPTDSFKSTKTDQLVSILAQFNTCDKVYIDLRNEHNHGLNYYREYGSSDTAYAQFQIGIDGGGFATEEYQTHGWPIFAISTTAFTATDPKKPGIIRLRLPGGPNTKPLVHRGQGYFYTSFRKTNHKPDTKETLRPTILIDADGFTAPIAFSAPKLSDNSVVPHYINLRYLKRIAAPAPTQPPAATVALKAEHFVDNLFELTQLLAGNDLRIPLSTDDVTTWHVTGATALVDETSAYGTPYMARIGVGRDPSNAYFFACTPKAPLSTDSAKTTLLPQTLAAQLETNIEFGRIEVTDTNQVMQQLMTYACLPNGLVEPGVDPSFEIDPSSMVILALDKDELATISTAAATFDATLDKRLVLRNPSPFLDSTGQPAATKYSLLVAGYRLGTTVVVASADTHLTVWQAVSSPRLFATSAAALNFNGLKGIDQNRAHFRQSRTLLDVNWGLHKAPDENAAFAAHSFGRVIPVGILGKVPGTGLDWFLSEVRYPTVTFLTDPGDDIVLSAGSRCWIGSGFGFYPVATFEKFICDLTRLNAKLDLEQQSANGVLDTLTQRITRIREMTVKFAEDPGNSYGISLAKLFDQVINAPPTTPPIRNLEDITYQGGIQESAADGIGVSRDIDTEMQLFRDYMGVEFGAPGTGVVVDLHHLFIGLDVLFHPDPNRHIDAGEMFVDPNATGLSLVRPYLANYPIGNNIDTATWAGDIGAAPPDWNVKKDAKYEARVRDTVSSDLVDEIFLQHYYATRSGDPDLYGDVFPHLIHQQMRRRLAKDASFRNVPAALYHFNRQLIREGTAGAFRSFFDYLNLAPTKAFRSQPTWVKMLNDAIRVFADLWWIHDNPAKALALLLASHDSNPAIVVAAIAEKIHLQEPLWPVVDRYTATFVDWLHQHQ